MKTKSRLKRTLLSLFPVSLLALSSAVLAQGVCNDMQFTDVTASAGIDHVYIWPPTNNATTVGGATAVDVNGDGWLDLYAVQGNDGPNLLYINDKNGGFTEEAASRSAQLNGLYSTGASAADFDNDGDMDIGVSVYFGNSRVLVNDGNGNFTQEIVLANPTERTFSSSWGDVDNDGLLELAIGQWIGRNANGPQGLFLYKNNGGTLQQYEFRTNPTTDVHIFAPRFADLNGDRLSDLHVIADYGASKLFMNVGGGMFTGSAGFGGENDMGHTIGDYDKDGDLDIFTTDIETNNGNTLWRNNGQASFTNVSAAAGIQAGGWAWAGSFGDLDNDADLDIYHVNGFLGDGGIWQDNPNPLFMNNDDGTFTEVGACAGADIALGSQGRGMHMFDYDNDGDLDIFVVNVRYLPLGLPGQAGNPVLLRNDTPANGRHWLQVTLDGTPPMHRNGIGSRVYVQTGSTTQMHEMHASSNFLSQDSGHIAHFGLNTASVADEVRAEWVTGDATVLTGVNADRRISIPSPTATVSTRAPAIGQNVTATSNESAPVEWEIGGNTYTDPVTTSFSSGGTKELKLLVYNSAMTQVVRTELIRVNVAGVSGTPEITAPTPGSTLPVGNVNFAWTSNGVTVDDWQLLVGTSAGDNSLYDSGVLPVSTTAAVVSGLPEDGSNIHVTLRWTDGGNASEKQYTYVAATTGPGPNQAPTVVAPTGDQVFGQGDTVNLDTAAAFDDSDGDTLIYSASGLPASLSINPDTGLVIGDLTNDDAIAGPDYSVVITATETGTTELYSVDDSFTLTVNNLNDAPSVVAPTGNLVFDEGDSVNLDAAAAFNDPDNDTLSYSASGLPASLSINPDTGLVSGNLARDDATSGPDYLVVVTATEVGTAELNSVDDSFMLTVNVVDTSAPVITRIGAASIALTVGDAYVDQGATATDDIDGDITANIVVDNPVNTGAAGTFTVRYNVSDAAGNAATEVTRTVTVNAPPAVVPLPPPPVSTSSGGGSTSLTYLLLLAGLAMWRRREQFRMSVS